MEAILNFINDTGFVLFLQAGGWKNALMLIISCFLLYLGIGKKFEPLLMVPIAFGMLMTNLPGANMFHEIFFAGGHIHWDHIVIHLKGCVCSQRSFLLTVKPMVFSSDLSAR